MKRKTSKKALAIIIAVLVCALIAGCSNSRSGQDANDPGEKISYDSAEELPKLMSEMEDLGMTLVSVHDRPQKTELGDYYLIECADSTYEDYEKLTKRSAFEFRYLGSFDVR